MAVKAQPTTEPTPNPDRDGVWAWILRDHYEHIYSVHPTEIEALRAAVAHGGGRVAFIKWGESLED